MYTQKKVSLIKKKNSLNPTNLCIAIRWKKNFFDVKKFVSNERKFFLGAHFITNFTNREMRHSKWRRWMKNCLVFPE